ncbi:hypothetical protein SAMN05878276_2424 [Aquipseudomonas alcaligenes]|uniref:hypothetical protein n=1 Tax=Pseudomonadaceae TaxID=135621 RepID=UPI000953C109|nr:MULTISPECIES: hypothetical protein [Pseudomonas]MDC7825833.1 hypothetical protein [Pseudomonas sp. BLCC-B13]SIS12977.1 hypothetical protein SAMN05878276_2424 [Pseudomonas alcaligenes]
MVTHYFTAPENVACGRAGANLNGSQDLAEVSCKLCLRSADKKVNEPVRKTPSLAELRAAAKAEKAAQAVAAASQRTVRVARGEWQQRLAQLPGRSRLPRGMAR